MVLPVLLIFYLYDSITYIIQIIILQIMFVMAPHGFRIKEWGGDRSQLTFLNTY